MLNASEYIQLVLKKKKWSKSHLCKEMNKIEEKLGEARTSPQNITNYLNGYHEIRPKWLVKVEYALKLPFGTLINLVPPPTTKESKLELSEFIKKVRGF